MSARIAFALLFLSALPVVAQDVNDATEKAMKAVGAKVAPVVARIESTGGQDAIWGSGPKGPAVAMRAGTGATTGVVVDPSGYVITSSFNFIGKPTDIFVTVPGKQRAVAKIVATDSTRMLTLLKFDQKDLPLPEVFPKKDVVEGMWSIALGRTLNPNLEVSPSIHGGIISGVDRVWGKAVQSDAKISPVNYGGPLCTIDGKVIGVIAPVSPTSEGEMAGFEWHDVGIGFAIPLEDIMRVLPKMKEGTPEKPVVLRAGVLGVTFREPDPYTDGCTINTVSPESPAAKAGMLAGDNIIEIDGRPVGRQAHFMHAFRPKYEGDEVSLKVKRGDGTQEFKGIKLTGATTTIEPGFLGILPMRDDPEAGVALRYVYPDSPAAKAGLKAGDRIMKVGLKPPAGGPKNPKLPGPAGPVAFNGRDRFLQIMQAFPAAATITVEVKKADKTETLDIVLGKFPEAVPTELPEGESSAKKALAVAKGDGKKDEPKKEEPKKEDKKDDKEKEKEKIKTGLIKVEGTGPTPRNYWVFLPDNYDPNVAHGLIVWFHPAGRDGRDADDMTKLWEPFCEKHHFIMMGPTATTNTGWVPNEADAVMDDMRAVRTSYTIDPQRVIAHGHGVGGQMAYYMAINKREVIRAAVPVGALLASNPKDPIANQRLQFLVIGGAKDPVVKDIISGQKKLAEKKYLAIYREMKVTGKEYVNDDPDVFKEMVRWMDSLDRQ